MGMTTATVAVMSTYTVDKFSYRLFSYEVSVTGALLQLLEAPLGGNCTLTGGG
jgi:hypothetical protein